MSDVSPTLEDKHAAAEEILRRFERERAPYVLYLHKFDIEILHGPDSDTREFAEDGLMDDLPEGVGLVGVAGSGAARPVLGRAPALFLGTDDEWQEVLTPVIRHADMIVSEFTFLSEGVRWELEKCCEFGKELQTVLILPPPGSGFETLDGLSPLDRFPRAVWGNQLFDERLSETFVARDLVERIGRIARASTSERFEAYAEGIRSRFPVSSEPLHRAYQARISDTQVAMSLGEPDPELEFVYFWDNFRFLSVLWCRNRFDDVPLEDLAFDLTQVQLVILQGIAHGVVPLGADESFMTDDFAMKLAQTAYTLIRRFPQRAAILEGLARRTFDRLQIECDWEADDS